MSYGTVMSYEYEEEDVFGKTVTKKLDLVFNALTLIKYHGFVGKDFMTDFFSIGFSSQKTASKLSEKTMKKIAANEELNYEDISEEDIKVLKATDYSSSFEFLLNLIAAMIATKEHPKKRDFAEIISEIPLFILYEQNFVTELLNFVSFGLKKNKILPIAKK